MTRERFDLGNTALAAISQSMPRNPAIGSEKQGPAEDEREERQLGFEGQHETYSHQPARDEVPQASHQGDSRAQRMNAKRPR